VQTAAEMADFRAGTRRKIPMPNQQHPSGIAILREASGRLALFINGQRVNVRRGQVQLALLACLLDSLGRAIPHRRLFTSHRAQVSQSVHPAPIAAIYVDAQGIAACK
jgi:hypothetical protein